MDLPELLVGNSMMSPRQLEVLRTYVCVMKGELNLREAASQRESPEKAGQPITVGSYYRSVQQGKETMRKSMTTLLIGLWLGYVRSEDVRRLFDLVARGGSGLSEEEIERMADVIEALVQKIVM
jgi:hypothetical protein